MSSSNKELRAVLNQIKELCVGAEPKVAEVITTRPDMSYCPLCRAYAAEITNLNAQDRFRCFAADCRFASIRFTEEEWTNLCMLKDGEQVVKEDYVEGLHHKITQRELEIESLKKELVAASEHECELIDSRDEARKNTASISEAYAIRELRITKLTDVVDKVLNYIARMETMLGSPIMEGAHNEVRMTLKSVKEILCPSSTSDSDWICECGERPDPSSALWSRTSDTKDWVHYHGLHLGYVRATKLDKP